MSGRAWRVLYAVRRAWWRVLRRRGQPDRWGIAEVNAPRVPDWAQPGDLMFGIVAGNTAPAGTWWKEAGSDEPWQQVPEDSP
jgi:hypothetical protein